MAGPMHGVQLFFYDQATDSYIPVAAGKPLPIVVDGVTPELVNNDNENPDTEKALPVESYGMLYDPVRNVWSRARGMLEKGQLTYSEDLEATLQLLNQTLATLSSNLMGSMDHARRLRVYADGGNNAAMNISQWGGQTAAIGAGAAGNGAPRVTPSNDVVSGSPQMALLHRSMLDEGMSAFANLVTF